MSPIFEGSRLQFFEIEKWGTNVPHFGTRDISVVCSSSKVTLRVDLQSANYVVVFRCPIVKDSPKFFLQLAKSWIDEQTQEFSAVATTVFVQVMFSSWRCGKKEYYCFFGHSDDPKR